MKYPKIFIQRFKEAGGLKKIPSNAMDIVILRKTDEFGTKLSIEIRKPEVKGPEGEIRSFRTDNRITVENIIVAVAKALAFFECERGVFTDGYGKLDFKNLELKINDSLKHLNNKIKEAFWDGVREYYSEII